MKHFEALMEKHDKELKYLKEQQKVQTVRRNLMKERKRTEGRQKEKRRKTVYTGRLKEDIKYLMEKSKRNAPSADEPSYRTSQNSHCYSQIFINHLINFHTVFAVFS